MARLDDHDDPSPEQDWDRSVSGALAGLRAPAGEAAPPTLDPARDLSRAGVGPDPFDRSWKTRGRLPFLGVFSVLAIALVLVAFWPAAEPDAGSARVTGARAAAPEAGVTELKAELRAERARTLRLEARVDALTGRLDAFEAERAASVARIEALERSRAESTRRAAAPPIAAAQAQAAGAPAAAPSADATGGWTVSLMTLSARGAAEDYAREVQAQGWPAEIMETGRRGGLWRVSSGTFAARADAEAHAATVAEALALESVWVTRRSEG